MYRVHLKTALVKALAATFNSTYPEVDFRSLRAGIEYPIEKSDYPGLWLTYADTSDLVTAGIRHVELVENETGLHEVTRWRFAGEITITAVALSSLERDRLFDELVRTFAFARQEEPVSAFRNRIESNELIAMNINFDQLKPSGDAAAPGTPWETEEIIYETSITLDVIGEFLSRPDTATLVPLRAIRAMGYAQGTAEPPFTGSPEDDVLDIGIPGAPAAGFDVTWPTDEWQ